MRFYEIRGGLNVPLSNEEDILVGYLEESDSLSSEQLDERGNEVARIMTSKGILNRTDNEDNTYTFTLNKLENIWRD